VTDLATAWNPEPMVLVGSWLLLVAFLRAFRRLRLRGRTDHAGWPRLFLFLLALLLGTLPLVSPLDEIGDSDLLSAHMLQHVLIGDAAPALALVALRGPLLFLLVSPALLRRLARRDRLRRIFAFLTCPRVSLGVWMLVIAGWHIPAAYDFALSHESVHHLEHASFVFAGVLVWMQIVDPARRRHLENAQRLGYMLVLVGAGTVLAAVLAYAPPLYPAYVRPGPRLLGLSPSSDQQLAGLVMLAEQVVVFAICGAFLLAARTGRSHSGRRGMVKPGLRPTSTARVTAVGP
jgi:cytochrome c oxidase assembly factor CtaG